MSTNVSVFTNTKSTWTLVEATLDKGISVALTELHFRKDVISFQTPELLRTSKMNIKLLGELNLEVFGFAQPVSGESCFVLRQCCRVADWPPLTWDPSTEPLRAGLAVHNTKPSCRWKLYKGAFILELPVCLCFWNVEIKKYLG